MRNDLFLPNCLPSRGSMLAVQLWSLLVRLFWEYLRKGLLAVKWLWMVLEKIDRSELPSCCSVPYFFTDFFLYWAICLKTLFQLVVRGRCWSYVEQKLYLKVFRNPLRAIGFPLSYNLLTKCIQNSFFSKAVASEARQGFQFSWFSLGNLSHFSSSLSKQLISLFKWSILEARLFCVEEARLLRLTMSMQQCSRWACFNFRASDFFAKNVRLLAFVRALLIISNRFVLLSCRTPASKGFEGSFISKSLMVVRFLLILMPCKRILFNNKTYSEGIVEQSVLNLLWNNIILRANQKACILYFLRNTSRRVRLAFASTFSIPFSSALWLRSGDSLFKTFLSSAFESANSDSICLSLASVRVLSCYQDEISISSLRLLYFSFSKVYTSFRNLTISQEASPVAKGILESSSLEVLSEAICDFSDLYQWMNLSYLCRSIRFSSSCFCAAFSLAFIMLTSFVSAQISERSFFFSSLIRSTCCSLIACLLVRVVISSLRARTLLACYSPGTHDICFDSSSLIFFFSVLHSSVVLTISIECQFLRTRISFPRRSICSRAASPSDCFSFSSLLRLLDLSKVD